MGVHIRPGVYTISIRACELCSLGDMQERYSLLALPASSKMLGTIL